MPASLYSELEPIGAFSSGPTHQMHQTANMISAQHYSDNSAGVNGLGMSLSNGLTNGGHHLSSMLDHVSRGMNEHDNGSNGTCHMPPGSQSNGGPPTSIDDRTYQLALELSLLGLDLDQDTAAAHGLLTGSGGLSGLLDGLSQAGLSCGTAKKSQNTTECVPVPSSEHVAEIVGRQGCKIKALRAKTNTYIKTPVRGEEPVFVVTGRKEDVQSAKREILSAADHFSQIRAQRKNNANGNPNANVPGQMTIQVRVPYRVVGLVVGPKGATIKRIQQNTSTYIITPSRDKEPIFEVTGLPDNVDQARKEIEQHIQLRTGGIADPSSTGSGSGGSSSGSVGSGDNLSCRMPMHHDLVGPMPGNPDHFIANGGLISRSDSLFSSASYDIFKNGTSGVHNGGSLSADPFLSVANGNGAGSVISSTSTLVRDPSADLLSTANSSSSVSRRNSSEVFYGGRVVAPPSTTFGLPLTTSSLVSGSAGSSANSTSSGSGSPGVSAGMGGVVNGQIPAGTKLSDLCSPSSAFAYSAILGSNASASLHHHNGHHNGFGSDSDEGLGGSSTSP